MVACAWTLVARRHFDCDVRGSGCAKSSELWGVSEEADEGLYYVCWTDKVLMQMVRAEDDCLPNSLSMSQARRASAVFNSGKDRVTLRHQTFSIVRQKSHMSCIEINDLKSHLLPRQNHPPRPYHIESYHPHHHPSAHQSTVEQHPL